MSDQEIRRFMKQGIAAAKAGDNDTAQQLFEKVIELDKNNSNAWFWLASVVDSDDQRRVCLGNVLYLDPDNKKAQRLLERLESKAAPGVSVKPSKSEGGGSRRLLFIVGGVLLLVSIVLVVIVVLGSGGGASPPPPSADTEVAGAGESTDTQAADTDIPAPTEPVLDVPPTWTPKPTPTPYITNTPALLPTPHGLPGQIAYGSDIQFFAEKFLSIYYAQADGSDIFVLGDADTQTRGRNPVFSPDAFYVAYEIGNSDGSSRIYLVDWLGEGGRILHLENEVNFSTEVHPAWFPDPTRPKIAFSAFSISQLIPQIYVSTLLGEDAPPKITQVTNNRAYNSWPAWSPDGKKLIYVSDRRAQGGVDIRMVDWPAFSEIAAATEAAATQQAIMTESPMPASPTPPPTETLPPTATPTLAEGESALATSTLTLTPTEEPIADAPYDKPLTENGNELIERAPDWSSDGTKIVFEATDSENYSAEDYAHYDSDIYIVDVNPQGALLSEPRKLYPPPEQDENETARDMQPRFSPDGRYVAFTSDQIMDSWEIFVIEIETGEVYQVTFHEREHSILGDWGPGR